MNIAHYNHQIKQIENSLTSSLKNRIVLKGGKFTPENAIRVEYKNHQYQLKEVICPSIDGVVTLIVISENGMPWQIHYSDLSIENKLFVASALKV